jgi:hypothetical protein
MKKPLMPSSARAGDGRAVAIARSIGTAALLLSAGFVLVAAVYFGLASCGGYVWHKEVLRAIGGILYLSVLLLPSSLLLSVKAKLIFALGFPATFVLLESAVAPFYPGPPQSLHEYTKLFIHALQFGPCS